MLVRPLTAAVVGAALSFSLLSAIASAQLRASGSIERNPSAATGRAGNATLSARALLAKDGSAVLEVSTGALDGDVPPVGFIQKAQFKVYDGEGNLVFNDAFVQNGQDSTVTYPLSGFHRGQSFQVQGNVRGVDGNRTDVVTVAGVVLERPDLAVTSLDVPSVTVLGTPVNVSAIVAERNGDVGASADCVLYVDGVETDRANDIWVDAGSSATCAFTLEPVTTGSRALVVAVENVVPTDWDTTNNTAQATLSVQDMVGGFELAHYEEISYHEYAHEGGTYDALWEGSDLVGEYDWGSTHSLSDVTFNTHTQVISPNAFIAFPVQIDATLSVDGFPVEVISENVSLTYADVFDGWFTQDIGVVLDAARGLMLHVVAVHDDPDFEPSTGFPFLPRSVVVVSLSDTRRTFLSHDFQNYWFQPPGAELDAFFESNTTHEGDDPATVFSADEQATWDLDFESNGVVVDSSITIPLTPTITGQSQALQCVDDSSSPESLVVIGAVCSESYWQQKEMYGLAYHDPEGWLDGLL